MPATIYFFIILELLVVSLGDLLFKRIPNQWSLLNLAFFVLLLIAIPHHYPLSFSIILYPAVILVVGFGLFVMKIMGGGDTKFLSTVFLLIPASAHPLSFEYLLNSTVVIGLAFFLLNTIKNYKQFYIFLKTKDFRLLQGIYGVKFSYAPVIFFAWIWMGWDQDFFEQIF